MHFISEFAGRLRRLAIDFKDHIAGLNARIVRRAGRTNALNDNAMHLVRHVDLLPCVWGQVAHCEPKLAALRTILTVLAVGGDFGLAVEFAHRHVKSYRLAIADHAQ